MIEPSEQTAGQLLEAWPDMSLPARVEAFRRLPGDQANDFFLEIRTRDQVDLLTALPEGERRIWLRLLPPDDAADVIQLALEKDRPGLMALLDDIARREVIALLAYKEDAAGGLMNPRFARLRPDMTVDQAISYLRRQVGQVATIHYAYALDESQRLLGVLSLRDLFVDDPTTLVRDVMRTEFISASELTDQEALARLFSTHRLIAIPILDSDGRMQGIVTVDDIVDVVQEEASEDIQKVGGMAALDAPYLEIGFWRMVRNEAGGSRSCSSARCLPRPRWVSLKTKSHERLFWRCSFR